MLCYVRRSLPALILALLLMGCSPSVEPGDGPAMTEEPSMTEAVPEEEPVQGEAKFGEKFVYPDGLEVEITRLRHGKLTDKEWKDGYDDAPAPDWVRVTIRVRNNTGGRVDVSETSDVTYGPDGEQAGKYLDTGSLDGPLVAGKAKTQRLQVFVPVEYQDDVVWVQNVDYEREPAIFVGSITDDLN